MVTMEMVWTLSLILFLIITFIRTRGINTASELQKYYLILIILSALSINPIALVLSIYMFLQLDTFGINIYKKHQFCLMLFVCRWSIFWPCFGLVCV